VEYRLTEKGRALESVVRAVAGWAESWAEEGSKRAVAKQPAGISGDQ